MYAEYAAAGLGSPCGSASRHYESPVVPQAQGAVEEVEVVEAEVVVLVLSPCYVRLSNSVVKWKCIRGFFSFAWREKPT